MSMTAPLRLMAGLFAACVVFYASPSLAVGTAAWPASAGAVAPSAALVDRVKNALEAAPYLYDRHIDVSVREGDVILSGFVFSDWDLRDALRIAASAASPHRVIDGLHIEEGGRH
jgi:osmotically-inducible protein OsmY